MSYSDNKFKKLFSLFLVAALILLSGCGLTVTKIEGTATTAVTTTEAKTTVQDKIEPESKVTTSATSASATEQSTERSSTKLQTTVAKATTAKHTEAATTRTKTVTCTIEIECKTILDNLDRLRSEKKAFLPSNGVILNTTTVTIAEGSTVFDVLEKVCSENTCVQCCTYCKKDGIQTDHVYTPAYDSEYIRGIHQLYEKDCGTQSGWMYSVNGIYPNYGVNKYVVKNGDSIKFRYTCNLGSDIGG